MAFFSKVPPLNSFMAMVDPKTGRPTQDFMQWWEQLVNAGAFTQGETDSKVPLSRLINTTAPIAGGGSLENDLTLTHDNTAVTPGTYGDATNVAQVTIDAKGHVTAAANVAISGGGGGAAWALAGTGQTATGVYDFAVDGAKANIDFIGLASFNELLVVARNLTNGTSGVRQLQVSVDNGSTYFSTNGDYLQISNTGVETATTAFAFHSTNSTAARSVVAHIVNTKGAAKFCNFSSLNSIQNLFVASSSDINAIRVSNIGGGNMTGGTVRVYAR